jgi:hypothetical protein
MTSPLSKARPGTSLAIPTPDKITAEWVDTKLRPALMATDDLRALHQWRSIIAARQTYLKHHRVPALELVKARALTDLRIGELLGPGEHGQTGVRNLCAKGLEVIPERERPELRRLAKHGAAVNEHIEAAITVCALSRRALLKVADESGRQARYHPTTTHLPLHPVHLLPTHNSVM